MLDGILDRARRYLAAGLTPIPVRTDGTKRPAVASWAPYQERTPSAEEVAGFFGGAPRGIATVCGRVSGGLEVIDFDRPGFFEVWRERVEAECPGLLERLPVVRTPKGHGRHVFLRSDACERNRVLARVRDEETGTLQTAIETRGEGGYVLLPGSPADCHPSGNVYQALDGPSIEAVPRISVEERAVLLDAARALAAGEAGPDHRPHEKPSPRPDRRRSHRTPGDDYSSRATLEDVVTLLEDAGWSVASRRADGSYCVTRPGKSARDGHSATVRYGTSGDGWALFHNFSANAVPFETGDGRGRSYTAFQVLALLQYGGDWSRCASELAARGYGERGAVFDAGVDLDGLGPDARPVGGDDDDITVEIDTTDETERPKDPGAFPARLLDVPGLIGDVMRFNLETAYLPQPVLALGSALTLMGTLAARKIATPEGLRTNLYVLGVCESGEGKEHARQITKRVLAAAGLGDLLGPEDFASASGLEKAVEERPAILFQLDEIGRMLRTTADSRTAYLYQIPTALMKLYSSATSEYRSRAYADSRLNRTIIEPCASLYGTTVPQSLYESLTTESLTDGLVARMLVFEVDAAHDPAPQEVEVRAVPDSLVGQAMLWKTFDPGGNLSGVHPQPRALRYTDEARDAMTEFARRMRAEKRRADSAYRAVWNRTAEHARKLATLRAVSCDGTAVEEVGIDAVEWATAVAEHLVRRAIWIARDWVGANEWESTKKRVLRIIREEGRDGIVRSKLTRKTQFLRARDRQEILEDFVTSGVVWRTVQKTKGRARTVYFAAPLGHDNPSRRRRGA